MFRVWCQNTAMKLIRVLTAHKHVSGLAHKKDHDFCVGIFKAQIGPECCFRFISVWFFFSQLVSPNEFHLLKSAMDNNMNIHEYAG